MRWEDEDVQPVADVLDNLGDNPAERTARLRKALEAAGERAIKRQTNS